jgi:hypothetical protein
VADILTSDEVSTANSANANLGGIQAANAALARRSSFEGAFTTKAKELVKGAGHVKDPRYSGAPLDDVSDAGQIINKSHQAILDVRTATVQGAWDTDNVMSGMSSDFWGATRQNKSYAGLYSMAQRDAQLRKAFSAGNLGQAGVPYGLVPFDLLAPSRLIYPVYTLFRNKFPRPAGQGASRQVYGLLGISGSQTGGQGIVDISMPELVGSNNAFAGSSATWPLNIPKTGSQTEYKLNVPYRFFGLSESLTWLAQFEGQGFEDISALANLVLLQEMMLGEEYQMIAGSSQNLATPAAPTVTLRTAGSNETALGTTTGTLYVKVTALNYFGETTASSSGSVALSTNSVADVVISPVAGAQQYNIYASTSNSANSQYIQVGTTVQSGVTYSGIQSANAVGGLRVTLQSTLASSSQQAYPTADTGTGGSNRMEGLIPTLTGLSSTGSGPYSNVGFEGSNVWKGGYINQSVGTHLSTNAIFTALDALWENNGMNNVTPGVYKADPSEIIADGGDLMRLANDMLLQGNALNYLLNISQDQVSGMRAGAAVAEFVNPVTRSTVKLTVHPWLSQGTALLMSYQLPQTWSHVDNAWEMTVVQDYVSVAWPVIDATFRYSIFLLGSLVAHAPFYSGILQGLQVSDVTPYS